MYENLRALRPNIDSKQGGRTRTLFLVLACITPLLIPVGGVLGAVTLLAINPASLLRTSRDTTRMANIASLNVGIETYVVEQNSLPTSLDQLTKYIQVIPADPKTQQSYYYSITPDGKHYKVCATMEQPNKFKDNQFCATDEGVDPIPRATKQN